jgi:hypothetical protein
VRRPGPARPAPQRDRPLSRSHGAKIGPLARAVGALTLAVVALGALAPAGLTEDPPLTTGDAFVREDLPPTARLFDLGVADVDDDGWLDLYSTNHHVRPLLLVNDRGGFVDRVLDLNLSTSRGLVGGDRAVGEAAPPLDAPGLYLYWTLNEFVVRAHRLPENQPVSGVILARDSEVAISDGAVAVTEHAAEGAIVAPFPATLVDTQNKALRFTAAGDGTLRIHSFIGFDAARVHIADPTPLREVFIGSRRLNPAERTFTLWPDDRHAMLWLDLDGDARTDLITVDGGMRGRSRGRVRPEYASYRGFRHAGDRFEEASPEGDLQRYGCITRQASLADVDRDGRLDVYVVCGGRGEGSANQLFRQTAPGAFSEGAAGSGLDLQGLSLTAWLDADGDGAPDLLSAADDLRLLGNHGGRFTAQPIARSRGRPRRLAVADFDRDGDQDVFVAAPEGSDLLLNEDGRYRAVAPADRGLPERAWCANWVDFDNDGRLDLHALPGGILRQEADGRFVPTGLLAADGEGEPAFCIWFDADNDGDRDLVVARAATPTLRERVRDRVARLIGQKGEQLIAHNPVLFFLEDLLWGHPFRQYRRWDLSLYRNQAAGQHWLQVQLQGTEGNRPALGARVTVETAAGRQTQLIGEVEESLRSQGHYRAYFGLGDETRVDRIEVVWPDGSKEERIAVPADQLLVIAQAATPPLSE